MTPSEPHMFRTRAAVLSCFLLLASALHAAPQERWIASWAASPQPSAADTRQPLTNLDGQTVRELVRLSLGGNSLRLRLSNEYGSSPLVVGAVSVAFPNGPSAIASASLQAVTFDGRSSVTIPAGTPILSDPIDLLTTSGSELTVSIFFPDRVASPTLHLLALKTAFVSQRGDRTRDSKLDPAAKTHSSIALTAVLVPAPPSARLVVAFGDSLTDGDQSTPDADRNWPSDLARRLAASHIAVANEGIVANRVLSDCFIPAVGCLSGSALARFERDALGLPGVTHVILFEGINDLGFPGAKIGDVLLADSAHPTSADDLITAYRQLISRAHARGVKILGATLTPFEGVDLPGYYSESKEAARQAINKWIRTSGSFDGVIDFDAVLRDPAHPSRLLPRFASPDNLHPNDLGYQAMADAVDLSLFNRASAVSLPQRG